MAVFRALAHTKCSVNLSMSPSLSAPCISNRSNPVRRALAFHKSIKMTGTYTVRKIFDKAGENVKSTTSVGFSLAEVKSGKYIPCRSIHVLLRSYLSAFHG
jgi:hypothetical protein